MKLVKNVVLSLMLITFFSLVIMSVSAADVNGTNTHIYENTIGDSTHISLDDHSSKVSYKNVIEIPDNEYENELKNNQNPVTIHGDGTFAEKLFNATKDKNQNDSYDSEFIGFLSDNENNGNVTLEKINVINFGPDFKLLKLNHASSSSYLMKLNNVTKYRVIQFEIHDMDSFNEVMKVISTTINYRHHSDSKFIHLGPLDFKTYDIIFLDFKKDLKLNLKIDKDFTLLNNLKQTVIIRGNGAIIDGNGISPYHNMNEYGGQGTYWCTGHVFATVGVGNSLYMRDITLQHFNTPIVNKGYCQMTDVTFDNNYAADFTKDRNTFPGGAIYNQGMIKCCKCSFTNNYCPGDGGAIYNCMGSKSTIINCLFDKNSCDGKKGNLRTNDNNNIYTSRGASCMIYNDNDTFVYKNITSYDDYINIMQDVKKAGYVNGLYLTFSPIQFTHKDNGQAFSLEKIKSICAENLPMLYFDNVENIYITGNPYYLISVSKNQESFLYVRQGQYCRIDNMEFDGFPTGIYNAGSIDVFNVTFSHCNNLKTTGGIHNDGLASLTDCHFLYNSGKHGGAILSYKGILTCSNCEFIGDEACDKGGAIYNDQGFVLCDSCKMISCSAKNDGGSIFNSHGMMSLTNVTFEKSSAGKKGGSIYSDFGDMLVGNCTFIMSHASKKADEIYSYGKEAKCIITGNCSVIGADGSVKNLNVVKDAPNEVVRWVLRISEIAACIALTIVSSAAFSPLAGSIVMMVSGALLAGVEDIIESKYLDHNFHIGNTLIIMAISGVLDGIMGGIAGKIEEKVFKVGTETIVKYTKQTGSVFYPTIVSKKVAKENLDDFLITLEKNPIIDGFSIKVITNEIGVGCFAVKFGVRAAKIVGGLTTGALDLAEDLLTEFIPRPDVYK